MQPITRLFFASALLVCTTAALGANADTRAREQWHGAIQSRPSLRSQPLKQNESLS